MSNTFEMRCNSCDEKMEPRISVTAEIIQGEHLIVENVDAFECPICGQVEITDGSFCYKRKPSNIEEWQRIYKSNLYSNRFN